MGSEPEKSEVRPKTCLTSGDSVTEKALEVKPNGQQKEYVVLCPEERAKGFVRPLRASYIHTKCGFSTTMSKSIAETYARNPKFYGSTFCVGCSDHFPVGEFTWVGSDEVVGS